MSTTTNEMPESAAAAVAEATRIAAQAARNGTETAKASIEAARSYVDDTQPFGRDLLARGPPRARRSSRRLSTHRMLRSMPAWACSTWV